MTEVSEIARLQAALDKERDLVRFADEQMARFQAEATEAVKRVAELDRLRVSFIGAEREVERLRAALASERSAREEAERARDARAKDVRRLVQALDALTFTEGIESESGMAVTQVHPVSDWREAVEALAAVRAAYPGDPSQRRETRCQHVLTQEAEKCRHGFYFGSTCTACKDECEGCRKLYAAPSQSGETFRPALGTCDYPAPPHGRPHTLLPTCRNWREGHGDLLPAHAVSQGPGYTKPAPLTPEDSRRLTDEGRALRRELHDRLSGAVSQGSEEPRTCATCTDFAPVGLCRSNYSTRIQTTASGTCRAWRPSETTTSNREEK